MKALTSGRVVILVLAGYALVCWAAREMPPVSDNLPVAPAKPTFHADQDQVARLASEIAWEVIGPEGRRAFALTLGCIVAGETVPGFWLGFIDRANWVAMSRPTAGCR